LPGADVLFVRGLPIENRISPSCRLQPQLAVRGQFEKTVAATQTELAAHVLPLRLDGAQGATDPGCDARRSVEVS
jgi:hypothetical protein